MKVLKVLLFFFLCLPAAFAQRNTGIAAAPPMGWNSYNCFGSAVHENEVKENADYVAANLKQYGWQYIVVDFLWSFDNPPGSRVGNPYQTKNGDGSFTPWLTMDKWGRLIPQPNKFPSAGGENGFKPLAKYVHSLGLKFGIHVMRGIPRQAVAAKSPVLGTKGITADMIANVESQCTWLNHMYGLDMSKPGAQEYLNSLLKLYASWGVDFIKVDDISRPYHTAEIEGYRKAIKDCGRQIVLSLSPGETPIQKKDHVAEYANMWRMADDFWDNWDQLEKMYDYAGQWQGVGGPGHWPDCDMIQIGKLSKRGPVGNERFSRFSVDEQYSHMSFWCIYRSPLMLGGNLPENRPLELKLFSNPEVLATNQQGRDPKQLYKKDGAMVWYSRVNGSKDIYIGLFNIGEDKQQIAVNLQDLGFSDDCQIRNLWTQSNLGTFKGQFADDINKHGAGLYRITSGK
jgi:alpha-galactosidase